MLVRTARTFGGCSRLAFAGFFALLLVFMTTTICRANEKAILQLSLPEGKTLALTDGDIAALPWNEIHTKTVWTEGVQHFRGPRLAEVLALSGLAKDDLLKRELTMIALNDFRIKLQVEDALEFDPILAREVNGVKMRVRDKGPLWLVFPRDDYRALQNAPRDELWIWQLSQIEVK